MWNSSKNLCEQPMTNNNMDASGNGGGGMGSTDASGASTDVSGSSTEAYESESFSSSFANI